MQRAKVFKIITILCFFLLFTTAFIWALARAYDLLEQRFNDPQKMERSRDLVLRSYESLHLAMTIDEVVAEIDRLEWPMEWNIRSNNEEYGVILLETPYELGAKNWVLHLMFEEKELAAIVVRTMDSESEFPVGAPPDVVRKGYKLPAHFVPYDVIRGGEPWKS